MTSKSVWRCPGQNCRMPLGSVRDGVLRPFVQTVTADRFGVVRVTCPVCGEVREWRPESRLNRAS